MHYSHHQWSEIITIWFHLSPLTKSLLKEEIHVHFPITVLLFQTNYSSWFVKNYCFAWSACFDFCLIPRLLIPLPAPCRIVCLLDWSPGFDLGLPELRVKQDCTVLWLFLCRAFGSSLSPVIRSWLRTWLRTLQSRLGTYLWLANNDFVPPLRGIQSLNELFHQKLDSMWSQLLVIFIKYWIHKWN